MFDDYSEDEFAEFLQEAIEVNIEENYDDAEVMIHSNAAAGLLTRNRGLVVKLGDNEFQITVVRSR